MYACVCVLCCVLKVYLSVNMTGHHSELEVFIFLKEDIVFQRMILYLSIGALLDCIAYLMVCRICLFSHLDRPPRWLSG